MKFGILFLAAVSCGLTVSAKKYMVFYLGGQSNMDGYGYVKELPDDLKPPVITDTPTNGITTTKGISISGNSLPAPWQIL